MSQHISADSHQTVVNEPGPFITIGSIRIRRDGIGAYQYQPGGENREKHFVYINFHGNSASCLYTEFPTEELARQQVDQLDWIFSKLYKEEKK